ncbi:hypothetical protein Y1Q_0011698 [Alligator mississippiensis]|uniref:Endonuclease/exonuclease/phosphatase domain-containing protein n=1 Tax=Alligator mississippiensis TaxID=8496 RepID=A0A151M0S2_ALLMI|nr:hypothetical protein Y1Q_0011698 [Alligator mississippiensis]
MGLAEGTTEFLMTLDLKLSNNQYTTVISANAQMSDADNDVSEQFFFNLDHVLTNTCKEDKIILLGDFNARVGHDLELWSGTIGKEGAGKATSNGILLLSKCSEYSLVITNTIFRWSDRNKTTWKHARFKHWHLLDYVIVRAHD